jgi:hypothetical protein
VWPSDLSSLPVVLRGTGFGLPAQAAFVHVVLNGTRACRGPSDSSVTRLTTLTVLDVTVRSDSELAFVVPTVALDDVLPEWTVTVAVAGQVASARVGSLAPTSPTLTFDSAPNGTHYFLVITGANYGPGVTGCTGQVPVSIDNQPCDALTVLVVSRVTRHACMVGLWTRLWDQFG